MAESLQTISLFYCFVAGAASVVAIYVVWGRKPAPEPIRERAE
jgi:hypothetical protein